MHIISHNYPLVPTRKQQLSYYNFFKSLCDILPCRTCRHEFCELVETSKYGLRLTQSLFQNDHGVPGTARLKVVEYVISLHANVNRRLGKKYTSRSDFWKRYYERFRTAK